MGCWGMLIMPWSLYRISDSILGIAWIPVTHSWMDRYKSWVSTFIKFHITYLHDMTPNYYMHQCLGGNCSCYCMRSLPGLCSNNCQGRKLCSQAPTQRLSGIDFCLHCFFFHFFRFMAKDTNLAMNAMQQTNLTVRHNIEHMHLCIALGMQ